MATQLVTTLECGWCGGVAITSEDGWFYEDEGAECAQCLMPGHVAIDFDDGDGTPIAWWSCDDREETVAKWVAEHPDHPEVVSYLAVDKGN
jgi:hypothetical protein